MQSNCAAPRLTAGSSWTESGIGLVVSGDFNSDSNPDLLYATQGIKQITLLLGNGRGSFARGQSFTTRS